MAQREPMEEPEEFETRQPRTPLPEPQERPDWLVGADTILEESQDTTRSMAPSAPPPGIVKPRPEPPPAKPEGPKSWRGAASSVPKLKVVPKRKPHSTPPPDEEGILADDRLGPGGSVSEDAPAPQAPVQPAFRPLDEPWYLVLAEELSSNRKIQIAAVLVLILIGVLVFRPRIGSDGTSLRGILSHPERFEGSSVVVRGQVLESFALGNGYVFHLRQGRDTVVVFSPNRRPRLRERVEVQGTVSTGYLDGAPRVAIFETPR